MNLSACLLLLTSVVSVASSSSASDAANLRKTTAVAPDDWISLKEGLEFQSAESALADDDEFDASILAATTRQAKERMLAAGDTEGGYQTMFEGDGMNRYHNIYATAWRYLGFYVDCSSSSNNNDKHDRDLGGGGNNNNNGCYRYLLWAAYADLDYTGGGIGEYQYYNRFTGEWSDESCQYSGSTYRCAKMDCHMPDTHFKLLGYFKSSPDSQHEMFGQLFKHEGVCVWNDEDVYEFMQKTRDMWPVKCQSSGTYDNGTLLYYHLKPAAQGNMTVGLYTDYYCSKDYHGELDTQTLLEGLGWYQETIDEWNVHFGAYKICQPCVAHSLQYMTGASTGRFLKEDENNNEIFQCNDEAGYTNCNQCMKFKTKTTMLTASVEDIILAHEQGSITYVPRMATLNISASSIFYRSLSPAFGSSANLGRSVFFFLSSLVVLAGGMLLFYASFTNKLGQQTMKEPLMVQNENMVIA